MTTVLRNHWFVRLTHWVNVVALTIMIGSGLQIFNAYPQFRRRGASFCCYPFAGHSIPHWATFGGWLAGARNWHFGMMWLLVANGIAYIVFVYLHGEWRDLVPRRGDIRDSWEMTKFYLFIRKRGPRHGKYNALQKFTYTALPSYYISDTVPVWNTAARGVWTLEVSGLVQRPLKLTLEMLQRLPSVTERVNHYCVEGWTAVESWTGVRMSDIARAAGALPEAKYVDFQSFNNGYHESWDIESVLHPETLIAYGLDGHMLAPAHGAPARLYSPVKLGYKNTKYLTRIVFMPHRNGGYWSDQGYEWYAGT